MKTIIGFVAVSMLLVAGCAQKVNDPADVQAIQKSIDDYVKAMNAGDADGIVALMTDKTVYADLNLPVAVGREPIRSMNQAFFSQFEVEFSAPMDDVNVVGDLAAARGTWTIKLTPKAQGLAPLSDSGSWIVVFARQADGSWKWDWVVPNSNQPLPGSTPSRADEQALLKIEQDWAQASANADAATLENIMAPSWLDNEDGKVTTKAQAIARLKSGIVKVESAVASDLSIMVFGDMATVHGFWTTKATERGKDISAKYRFMDLFAKRDGRWQAVSTYSTKVQ